MGLETLIYAAISALLLVVITLHGTKRVVDFGQHLRDKSTGVIGLLATVLVLGLLLLVILTLPLGIVLALKYSGLVGDDQTGLGVVYFVPVLSAIIAAYYSSRSRK